MGASVVSATGSRSALGSKRTAAGLMYFVMAIGPSKAITSV